MNPEQQAIPAETIMIAWPTMKHSITKIRKSKFLAALRQITGNQNVTNDFNTLQNNALTVINNVVASYQAVHPNAPREWIPWNQLPQTVRTLTIQQLENMPQQQNVRGAQDHWMAEYLLNDQSTLTVWDHVADGQPQNELIQAFQAQLPPQAQEEIAIEAPAPPPETPEEIVPEPQAPPPPESAEEIVPAAAEESSNEGSSGYETAKDSLFSEASTVYYSAHASSFDERSVESRPESPVDDQPTEPPTTSTEASTSQPDTPPMSEKAKGKRKMEYVEDYDDTPPMSEKAKGKRKMGYVEYYDYDDTQPGPSEKKPKKQ